MYTVCVNYKIAISSYRSYHVHVIYRHAGHEICYSAWMRGAPVGRLRHTAPADRGHSGGHRERRSLLGGTHVQTRGMVIGPEERDGPHGWPVQEGSPGRRSACWAGSW